MFVYKYTETTAYFLRKSKLCGWITQELLALKMPKLQGIAFIWIQTYREIFKSTLVYL